MNRNDINGVVFYSFEIYDKIGLKNCCTTRIGGVSEEQNASLNFSQSSGDSYLNVLENYKKIASAVGFSVDDIVMSNQTHTTNLLKAEETHRGKGIIKKRDYFDIDGLYTSENNIVLETFSADCATVFFYDSKNHAIALAHSGWRGTANEISRVVINKMKQEFNSSPDDLLCGIGPCIGVCCFEVSDDVYEIFSKLDYAKKHISEKNNNRKYFIDLTGVITETLVNCGVPENQIEAAKICTKCNQQEFFSHRLSGKKRGSMAAFFSL